jgi:hypothetical protein
MAKNRRRRKGCGGAGGSSGPPASPTSASTVAAKAGLRKAKAVRLLKLCSVGRHLREGGEGYHGDHQRLGSSLPPIHLWRSSPRWQFDRGLLTLKMIWRFHAGSTFQNSPLIKFGQDSCGFGNRVVAIGDRDVLLVKRFDREKAEAGYRRARMVSALTLLKADDSPQSRDKWSYLLLAEELRRVSAEPKKDAEKCSSGCVQRADHQYRRSSM